MFYLKSDGNLTIIKLSFNDLKQICPYVKM